MDTQSRERRFERFAADVVKIDIDSLGRRQFQLLENRTGFVIERPVKSALLAQKL